MRMLFEHHEGGRSVRVYEDCAAGSRLYIDGRALYTHVDAMGDNLLRYIEAMARQLHGASDVLLLGTAGGALATCLSRRGAKVTAVDNWPMAFEIARRWFHLPSDVDCVHAEALAFLRATPRRWPAIAIDVFKGERIPKAFIVGDVGAALTRAVDPGGLVVWNVADSPNSHAARQIETLLQVEGWAASRIAVMDADVGNTLVIGRAPMLDERQAA